MKKKHRTKNNQIIKHISNISQQKQSIVPHSQQSFYFNLTNIGKGQMTRKVNKNYIYKIAKQTSTNILRLNNILLVLGIPKIHN